LPDGDGVPATAARITRTRLEEYRRTCKRCRCRRCVATASVDQPTGADLAQQRSAEPLGQAAAARHDRAIKRAQNALRDLDPEGARQQRAVALIRGHGLRWDVFSEHGFDVTGTCSRVHCSAITVNSNQGTSDHVHEEQVLGLFVRQCGSSLGGHRR
jgi:hypothetical protein